MYSQKLIFLQNAFLIGTTMELVGMVAGSFSVNYWMLIVFRTMAGLGAVALFNVIFVIGDYLKQIN